MSIFCTRCGKPLQEVRCLRCSGKGYVRRWVFSKRECPACSGSGVRIRCPDERLHTLDDRKVSGPIRVRRRLPNAVRLAKPTRSIDFGKRTMRVPWDLTNPDTSHPAHPRHRSRQWGRIPWDPTNPDTSHPMHPRHHSSSWRKAERRGWSHAGRPGGPPNKQRGHPNKWNR